VQKSARQARHEQGERQTERAVGDRQRRMDRMVEQFRFPRYVPRGGLVRLSARQTECIRDVARLPFGFAAVPGILRAAKESH
jgi:hypothetical protein